jgi:hypothetical protein
VITTATARFALGAMMALAAAIPACSVPLDEAEIVLQNACDSSTDCADGGACVDIGQGRSCVGTKADLPGLIVEVSPSSSSTYGAGTAHLIMLENLASGSNPGGFVFGHDLHLLDLVQITPGKVFAPADAALRQALCAADDGSLPAKIKFHPIAPFVGIALEPYSATTKKVGDEHAFNLEIPPGEYDIFVEFTQQEGCEVLPPFFIPRKTIRADVTINIDLLPPSRLTGTIAAPSIDGWSLDMVEPERGGVISKTQIMRTGDPISLEYYDLAPGTSPIIRLRPPAGAVKPQALWVLDAVDFQDTDEVALTLAAIETTLIDISGRVLDDDLGLVAATLTIKSMGLEGAGENASYEVQVDTDGEFTVSLLRGSYSVIARPKNDPTKALAVKTWDIHEGDLAAGHDIHVAAKTTLRGRLVTPTDEPMSDAPIVAVPPLPQPIGYLEQVLGVATAIPDQAATSPDADGVFSLPVDPGSFDVSVQAPAESGFPWYVRSQVEVPKSGADFGTRKIAYPVALVGSVLDPLGVPVADAVIRAWLPVANVNAKSGLSGTVIQIAEATSKADGSYVLLLPPSITE